MYIIKMYFRETRCENLDWIHLAQHRDQLLLLVNMVIDLLFK